ncbi:MAG TPA: SAM-dependent chlorinase/fluorinase [Anaerolineaceae bacterium]|nr:SAM-dependent chlorinase/fluorinase [Anaerolineaceae bacterium]
MPLVTLTTDFGNKDGFVGTMKGVIWGICPGAQIADISHEITPQNVSEGAAVLRRAVLYFPAGTVHIAVVDPGVGTARRALAARIRAHYFVGPDNGLFSPLIEDAQRTDSEIIIVELNKPRYWLAGVSRTFHGRDVFAPAGAHLAAGISLEEMGRVITDPVLLPMPKPERIEGGWRGQVLGADRFGNLTTNLPWTQVAGRELLISIKGSIIHGLSNSYGQHQPGELVALVDSGNFLEVAVVNGSAEKLLGARVGDAVEVLFGETE